MAELEAGGVRLTPPKEKKHSGVKGRLPIVATVGGAVVAGAGIASMLTLGIKEGSNSPRPTDTGSEGNGTTLIQPAEASGSTPPPGITIETSKPVEKIRVDQQTYDYFKQVVLTSEYDGSTPVFKWEVSPTIKIHGTPTAQDLETLQKVIGELNSFQQQITLSIVEGDTKANIDMYFMPRSQFGTIDPMYTTTEPNAAGWFGLKNDLEADPSGNGKAPPKGIVLVDSTVDPKFRRHLIAEEVSQVLGPRNDSDMYLDSMWSHPNVEEFSDLDKKVIGLLYNSQIKNGMSEKQVQNVIEITQ